MTTVELVLSGELDIARKQEVVRTLNPGRDFDIAVLDMSAVTFVDSSCIGALVDLRHEMIARGHRGLLRLTGVSPEIRRVFKICSLDRVFEFQEAETRSTG